MKILKMVPDTGGPVDERASARPADQPSSPTGGPRGRRLGAEAVLKRAMAQGWAITFCPAGVKVLVKMGRPKSSGRLRLGESIAPSIPAAIAQVARALDREAAGIKLLEDR